MGSKEARNPRQVIWLNNGHRFFSLCCCRLLLPMSSSASASHQRIPRRYEADGWDEAAHSRPGHQLRAESAEALAEGAGGGGLILLLLLLLLFLLNETRLAF